MGNEIKENWCNNLRALIAYWIAKFYQISNPVLSIPILGELWMDLLYHLCDFISPFETAEDCINPIMVVVIRERMGISEEEFNLKIEEIRNNDERESLGLPAKHSTKIFDRESSV